VQKTDWNEVREGMEGAVARLLGTGLERSREGIEEVEESARAKVQETVDRSRAASRKSGDEDAAGIDRAATATVHGAEEAVASSKEQSRKAGAKSAEVGDAATAKKDKAVADAKSGAQGAADKIKHSGGTVDTARGAVRDAVGKEIKKDKEVTGKAQAVVRLATDKLESITQSATLSHSTAVKKALHERYEKPDGLKKSVEEALEERYKPVGATDNTVLKDI